MGQYFQLFNIDKCIYSEEVYSDASMDELHSNVFRRDLVRLLAAPTVPFPEDPLERKFQKTPCSLTLQESNVNVAPNLPPEIHTQILEHLCKYYDVLAFCMASQYCWTVGLRRLKTLWAPFARKECGSWAGDRLIILGDWSEDTPSAILPRDMVILKRHYARMRNDALEELYDDNDFDDSDSEGWDFESMVDDKVGKFEIFRVLYRLAEDKPLYNVEEETKRFTDPQLNEIFKDWLHPSSFLMYSTRDELVPTCSPWLLRNLSQRLYVRSDALCPGSLAIDEPPFTTEYGMTLADAVRESICFSGDPRGVYHEGDCPGDRFDIVRENEFLPADGWEDVTGEVKEELKRRL